MEQQFSYQGLYELLEERKEKRPEGSYTTYLFEKGLDKILKKVGEECTEVIIAGKAQDKAETIYEIADLMYHVMVLMVEMGISVEDITREEEKRPALREGSQPRHSHRPGPLCFLCRLFLHHRGMGRQSLRALLHRLLCL